VAWLHGSSRLIHSSLPLDRTAQGGTRREVKTAFWLVDPLQPDGRRRLAELPGGGWFGAAVSRDDRQLALVRYLSANESQIWLLDLGTGQARQVLPAAGDPTRRRTMPGSSHPTGRACTSPATASANSPKRCGWTWPTVASAALSAHIPWDVSGLTVSDDGRHVAVQVNVDGRDELRLFDGLTLAEQAAPRLPPGSVGSIRFHRGRNEIAFALNGAKGPNQLYSLALDSARVEPWTQPQSRARRGHVALPGPVHRALEQLRRAQHLGLLTLPPARFTGKRPVLIEIHGGPEAQAKVGFQGRYNYFTQELGIALIEPNVRGSSGFGKTFLALDDGVKREDSVRDIGALLDWIAKQPGLDASRVMVSGGSYGGYMSLAVAATYGDRIAGAIDDVGISHFVTFLTNTESYRRDLRRTEYGDERDPAMRAFLDRISPLTNAHRIRKPLFVVQGRNDPRVPYTEAEQIVERARAAGTPVWYLRAENEGHGFVRKENADYRFYAMVRFIETVLLK
jgi:dipeptidyl aminopeptidase/acylaminoacyl peptidase